jgi:hypothetical protein
MNTTRPVGLEPRSQRRKRLPAMEAVFIYSGDAACIAVAVIAASLCNTIIFIASYWQYRFRAGNRQEL